MSKNYTLEELMKLSYKELNEVSVITQHNYNQAINRKQLLVGRILWLQDEKEKI